MSAISLHRLYSSPWADAGLIGLLSLLYFGSLGDLQWSTHGREYMRDSATISSDFTLFLAPDKLMPGRPTFEFILWLWFLLWGDSPFAFHWLGVGLHAGASALLIYAARQMGWSRAVALVAGLLFLTHVGHFRAIHWIAAFCYPLVLICGLASMVCVERYAYGGQKRGLFWIYAISIFAMGAHVSAAFIYPMVLFCLISNRREQPGAVLRLIPLGPLMAGCGWLLSTQYKNAPQNAVITDGFHLMDSAKALAALYSRLFTTAHWMPVSPFAYATWEVYIALLLFLGLGLYAWKYKRSVQFWLVWSATCLLPYLILQIDAEGQLVAGPSGTSRYLYVASAGSSFVIAVFAHEGYLYLEQRAGKGIAQWVGVGALLIALTSSFIWLKRTEGISLYISGRYYEAAGERKVSAQQFKRAIARGQRLVDAEEVYVRAYLPLLAIGEGHRQWLAEGLAYFPDNLILNVYRLIAASMAGDGVAFERLSGYKNSNELSRLIAITYYNWSVGLCRNGASAEAIVACRSSVHYAPRHAKAWALWGVIARKLNRIEEARQIVDHVRQLVLDETVFNDIIEGAERVAIPHLRHTH